MTELQFTILRHIHSSDNITVVSLLNALDADPVSTSAELSTLTDQGLVEKSAVSDSHCALSLTYKGISALLSETEDRTRSQLAVQQQIEQEQHRKEEQHRIAEDQAALQAKEHASDRRFQVRLTLLQALLSFLTGALVANLDRLLPFIFRLLHF